MEGVVYTLACSFIAAFYFISNDIFKIRGDILVFWRSLFSVIFILPFIPLMQWDQASLFYIIFFVAGMSAAIADAYMFNASRIYSAAAMSRVIISRNILMFMLWPLIMSGYWERLTDNLFVLYGSILLLLVSTLAFYRMKNNPISMAVILAAIPVIILLTISDILMSYGVYEKTSINTALTATLFMGIGMVFVISVSFLFSLRKQKNLGGILFQSGWVKAGVINGILLIGIIITKSIALAHLENPGYFGAIVAVYTLWIYLIHKYWMKREDNANPLLGFVIVLCSIGVAILSLYVPK